MSIWFLISLVGVFVLVPLHFLSVEHRKLEARFGTKKGTRIGKYLGYLSGWGYFLFLFGVWLSPQDSLTLPIFDEPLLIFNFLMISAIDLVLALLFIVPGIYFGIKGVTDLGLEVSETHRAKEVVSEGVYSRVRHPQYLGGMLSHIGISFLLSALLSLIATPLIILRDIIVCLKEEKELIREFGESYEAYRESVPMLIPRFRRPSAVVTDQQMQK